MSKICFSQKEMEDIVFLLEWSREYVINRDLKQQLQQTIYELQVLVRNSG
ncbi:hypothetical protein [Bacillus kwashiorkori]|nr:hypothetical protein [Bacillus kwashiorkori]